MPRKRSARKRNMPTSYVLVPGELIDSRKVPGEVWAMLNCYTKWLNMVHEDLGEEGMEDWEPVGVEDYWIEESRVQSWVDQGIVDPDKVAEASKAGGWDGPRTVLDVRELQHEGGSMNSLGTRLIQISCTPFHDEGGHANLTAGFELEDIDDLEPPHRMPGHVSHLSWELDWMVAWFDCQTDLIVSDGGVVRKDMG